MEAVKLQDKQDKEPRKAYQLPEPRGYKILIKPVEAEKVTEGGIWKPDNLVDLEQTASVVGFVVKLGNQAYKDKERFDEPWCKEGDFVLVGAYKGWRFKIHGEEFRLINDDQVGAVVEDPRGYSRA